MAVALRLSDNALTLLKNLEGWRSYEYDDATGRAVPHGHKPIGTLTIGYGHALAFTEHYPDGITRAQGESLLKTDVLEAEIEVRDFFEKHGLQPTQNQFDAVVLLVYNCGSAPLRAGFGELLKERMWKQAADRMLDYNKETRIHNGIKILVFSSALAARRAKERALFLTK